MSTDKRPPTRARTAEEQREKGVGGEPVTSRREAVEVALSQVLGGTVYGSDVNKLRTHAEVILGYVDQWDAWEATLCWCAGNGDTDA